MNNNGNTTGIDGILAKLIQNLGEDTHKLLYEITTKSYETRDSIKEFANNRTIVLPKKGKIFEYSNYRTISNASSF